MLNTQSIFGDGHMVDLNPLTHDDSFVIFIGPGLCMAFGEVSFSFGSKGRS